MGKSVARSDGERGAAPWAWVAVVVGVLVAGVVWWSCSGEEPAAPERVAMGAPAAAKGGEVVRQAVLVPPAPAEDEAPRPSSSRAVADAEGEPAAVARKVVVLCVDARSGEPVPHAEVHVIGEDSIPDEEFERAMASGAGVQSVVASFTPAHRADADGRAVVPWPSADGEPEAAALIAFAPGRMAMLEPSLPPDGELRLELAGVDVLVARVLDVRGQPVAGVLVELRDEYSVMLAARTDADGVARIELPPGIAEVAEDRELTCAVAGVFEEHVEVPLDVHALTGAPLELRLPPFGYVSVSASSEGRAGALDVELAVRYAYDARPLSATLRDTPWVAGPVALGLTVFVEGRETSSAVPWRVEAEGPTAEGEVVELVLERERALGLSGRAVDEQGEPLARAVLKSIAVGTHGGATTLDSRYECDGQGRFNGEVVVVELGQSTHIHLRTRHRDVELVATIPLTDGWPEALGDVVFTPLPPIARGRWVDRDRNGVGEVQILVHGVLPGQDDGEENLVSILYAPRIWPDGRFEILGVAPGEAGVRLTAYPAEFVSSERDVRVGEDLGDWVLERYGGVHGRVLVDAHVPLSGLGVVSGAGYSLPVDLGADGSFEIGELEPGRVQLLLEGEDWVGPRLLLWSGAVEDGAATDVGLLDARGRLGVTSLDVRDVAGDRVPVFFYDWPFDSDPLAESRRLELDLPTKRTWANTVRREAGQPAPDLVHMVNAEEAEVYSPGHRAQSVRLTGGPMRIDLGQALVVELRLSGASVHGNHRDDALIVDLEDGVDGSVVARSVVIDGVARLVVTRPGNYRAQLFMASGDGEALIPSLTVADTTEHQVFEFEMPELTR